MLSFFRIFAEIRNFCSPWKSPHMVFQLHKKNPQIIFFSLKILFHEKKMLRVTIFRKQNGGWIHLSKKNKKNCRRQCRTNSVQGEQKKTTNGYRTSLVLKEDKKGLNEPQTTIFHRLSGKNSAISVFTPISQS